MVCLGFEPGPQDGRRRRNHGAMAATPNQLTILVTKLLLIKHELERKTPSLLPPRVRVPSQAHHQCFYQIIFDLCHAENTKINKKRPGLAHF